jgi:hypothetical protein
MDSIVILINLFCLIKYTIPTVRIDSTKTKNKWHDVNKHFFAENLLLSVRSKTIDVHRIYTLTGVYEKNLSREEKKKRTRERQSGLFF